MYVILPKDFPFDVGFLWQKKNGRPDRSRDFGQHFPLANIPLGVVLVV
jgi:hypothetical protein